MQKKRKARADMKYIILGVDDEDFQQMAKEAKWSEEGGMRGLNPFCFYARTLKSMGYTGNTKNCLVAKVIPVDMLYTRRKEVPPYEKYRNLPSKKEVLLNIKEKLNEWIEELENNIKKEGES